MATPRKHWWRVADSILRKPWTIEDRSVFLGLGCYLNQRWARDGLNPQDACEALIGPGDLQQITGARTLARARRMLHAFAMHCECIVDEQGMNTLFKWPKWAEFQDLTARELPESCPRAAPSADARRKTQDARRKKEKKTPSVSAEAAPEETFSFGGKRPRILNIIAKLPGAWDEKEGWWEAEQFNVQAWAEATEKPLTAAVLACYRRYLTDNKEETDRPYQDHVEKTRLNALARSENEGWKPSPITPERRAWLDSIHRGWVGEPPKLEN